MHSLPVLDTALFLEKMTLKVKGNHLDSNIWIQTGLQPKHSGQVVSKHGVDPSAVLCVLRLWRGSWVHRDTTQSTDSQQPRGTDSWLQVLRREVTGEGSWKGQEAQGLPAHNPRLASMLLCQQACQRPGACFAAFAELWNACGNVHLVASFS